MRYPATPPTVDLYVPLRSFAKFHSVNTKWRVVVGSNRSGKTLCAAVELARAVLGRDPYKKYRPNDGVAVIVGLDYEHVGMLWRKLYLPGAIKIIYDQALGRWRSLRFEQIGDGDFRISPRDMERRNMWRDAPPLIPPEEIDKIAWYNHSLLQPHMVLLKNGWQIFFKSSRSAPKQGEHFDLVWIDEQISNPAHFYELVRGIVDVDPMWPAYGIWTASGQKQNPLLYDFVSKSDRSTVTVFQASIVDNPYVSREERERFAATLPEFEREVRVAGRFAVELWRIYHDFNQSVHVVDPFMIPPEWTRYLAIDPGTSACATVFAAVDHKNNIWVYDACLLRSSTADRWAQMMSERNDCNAFEAWIMDKRAGRTRSMAGGKTVAQIYMEACSNFGFKPRVFGSLDGFVPGNDNPAVRIEIMHKYLAGDGEEKPKLRIFSTCAGLIHNILDAQYDEHNPNRRIRGEFDLLDALEYLVAYEPRYVARKPAITPSVSPVVWTYHTKHRKKGYVASNISIG